MGEAKKKTKEKYRDTHGETRVATALKWLGTTGMTIAPEILSIAGTYTGAKGLNQLADKIRGDGSISGESTEYLLKQIDFDIADAEEKTERWKSDMASNHWLPKLIRPLVVANFTILIDIVVISSMAGKPLGEAFLPLLMTMGVTAIGGYFTLREYGKAKSVK